VIVCEGLPTTVIMKAVPSSCDSNYWLHSCCKLLMLNSMGQSTDKDKAGLHLFSMKFTAIERKTNCNRCDSVCRHLRTTIIMKAVPSSSNSNYWPSLLQMINAEATAWDNQLMKTKLGSTHLVWNSQQ
jgi:hypothetical protein